jgi:SIR2-like domain
MNKSRENNKSCTCFFCSKKLPFDLNEQLFESFKTGNLVLFAGSGISTECPEVFPFTLYDDVCADLRMKPDNGLGFPELMSRFCKQTNGRSKLLQKIKNRFSYIESFPELYQRATTFHSELSTMYPIDTIITTNWDNYFEKECGAIPFVTANDFAFWSIPGRKVIKIHGSVNSYGSLVITKEDYNRCYTQLSNGSIGSYLKLMLATKTIVYIGFSFKDDDFLKIHKFLSNEMKDILPQSYIVTLDDKSDARFHKLGLTPIYTDGTHFLSVLKNSLIEQNKMFPDDRFEIVKLFLSIVDLEHDNFSLQVNWQKHPEDIYTFCYQDGLKHALERMIALQNTGYYSHGCNIVNAIKSYEKFKKEKVKIGKYQDVAYIEGYINGLSIILINKDQLRFLKVIPLFYIFGYKGNLTTMSEYKKGRKNAENLHKKAFKHANKIVENMLGDSKLVYHHTPFLL